MFLVVMVVMILEGMCGWECVMMAFWVFGSYPLVVWIFGWPRIDRWLFGWCGEMNDAERLHLLVFGFSGFAVFIVVHRGGVLRFSLHNDKRGAKTCFFFGFWMVMEDGYFAC